MDYYYLLRFRNVKNFTVGIDVTTIPIYSLESLFIIGKW